MLYELYYWPPFGGAANSCARRSRTPFSEQDIFRHYPELDGR